MANLPKRCKLRLESVIVEIPMHKNPSFGSSRWDEELECYVENTDEFQCSEYDLRRAVYWWDEEEMDEEQENIDGSYVTVRRRRNWVYSQIHPRHGEFLRHSPGVESWQDKTHGPLNRARFHGGKLLGVRILPPLKPHRKRHLFAVEFTFGVPEVVYMVQSNWSHPTGTIPHSSGEVYETWLDAFEDAEEANRSPWAIGGNSGFYVSAKLVMERGEEQKNVDLYEWSRELDPYSKPRIGRTVSAAGVKKAGKKERV